jgi:hypothetical protein
VKSNEMVVAVTSQTNDEQIKKEIRYNVNKLIFINRHAIPYQGILLL